MEQWIYKHVQLPKLTFQEEAHNRTLQSLGNDGWEMVGIAAFDDYYVAWFKRRKPASDPYR